MKKFFLLLLLIMLSACTNTPKNKTLQELLDEISINEEIDSDIVLPETYQLNGEEVIAIWESSNVLVLSNDGKVTRSLNDSEVTLSLTLMYKEETLSKNFDIVVLKITPEDAIDTVLNKITVPTTTKSNINLQKQVTSFGQRFTIEWTSSNKNVISNEGVVALLEKNAEVTLTAKVTYDNVTKTKDFNLKVTALSDEEKADYIVNSLNLPTMTSYDLNLITNFPFNLTGTWESSDITAIDNTGKVNPNIKGNKTVTLTLSLNNGIRRTFEVVISKNNHLVIDNSFEGTKENLEIVDGKLQLTAGSLTGTYTSNIIDTLQFTELVGSWASTSSKDATVEFQVRVRANGEWSKYFSYGEWGFGRENKSYDSSDSIAKLATDEVKMQAGKIGNAIQFKVTLKRTSASVESPKTSLLAAALLIPGYSYTPDISNLPSQKIYDVPQLYQHVVPTIGDSICSPTSSTMLLKYYGIDMKAQSDYNHSYEHEYFARRVNDYGHNIFGNWVYNTVGMSAFGFDSYVKRMYSYQELLVHLNEVGPISASIKGSVVVEKGKNYTTNGHLIVVKGYRIDSTGQIYIIVNDPNLSNVDDEMKLNNFLSVWRNVIYVIEPKK